MFKAAKFVGIASLALALMGTAGAETVADLVSGGRADEALRTLQQQANGNANGETFLLFCRVYYGLEDWDHAVRNCERAVQLEPNNAHVHHWMGRAYGSKADNVGPLSAYGFARKTVAEFERALQLQSANRMIRRDLAEYYATAPSIVGGGKDKARKLSDDIASSDPATAAWIRGLIASRDKNWPAAEREYRQAYAASGKSAAYMLDVARVFRNQKRWQDFEMAIVTAIQQSKTTPEDLYDASELLIDNGRNLPYAQQILRTYLKGKTTENGPAYRAHWLLGKAYEKSGDRANAQSEYRSALSLASGFRRAQQSLRNVGG